jgi:hypothetical protein
MILADNAPLNKNQCHAVSMYLVAGKLTAPLCNHFFFVLVSSLNMYPVSLTFLYLQSWYFLRKT